MARTKQEPLAPSPLVPALLRLLRARGVDPGPLASRLGVAAADEEKDEALATASVVSDLLEAVAIALGQPHLGLLLPTELPLRRYGLAEITARSSATAREALGRIARYAPLVHPDLEGALEEDGAEARWTLATPSRPRGAPRHVHEYALAFTLTQLRAGGVSPRVLRVWFASARPRDLSPLARFFGTEELSFGRPDSGVALDAEILGAPMKGGDARLLATVDPLAEDALRAHARGLSLAAQVAESLPALLPDGATLEGAAHRMHMSPRTLQRRLDEEGTRFSEVLDEVRAELARAWVADESLTLSEVGARLGFSELATFSRAFKRWVGIPPGLFRRTRTDACEARSVRLP